MQRQVQQGACSHCRIAEGQLPYVLHEDCTLSEWKGIAGLSEVPDCCGNHQYEQPNPKQHEEAAEVSMLALRIEVGYAVLIVDGWKEALLALVSNLLSC